MQQMKLAATQIPASALARPSRVDYPEMHERLLQQVITEKFIFGYAQNQPSQRFPKDVSFVPCFSGTHKT
jgi:hypothetical protein